MEAASSSSPPHQQCYPFPFQALLSQKRTADTLAHHLNALISLLGPSFFSPQAEQEARQSSTHTRRQVHDDDSTTTTLRPQDTSTMQVR